MKRYNIESCDHAGYDSYEDPKGQWIMFEDVEPLLKALRSLLTPEQFDALVNGKPE